MTQYQKRPIDELYFDYAKLELKGWKMESIFESYSRNPDHDLSFPIIGIHNNVISPTKRALWIIAGIHGEEPAGPNMLADNIDYISKNLKDIPTLILPLCNPIGYHLNQRYLNDPLDGEQEMSVGDCEHIILNAERNGHRNPATNHESMHIARYLLKQSKIRSPYASLDLHEDMKVHKGYVYSQGVKGVRDELACKVLGSLREHVEICDEETTRFGEKIINGIVAPVEDGSIDEFIASNHIFYDGKLINGIGARTVLVVETPAYAYDMNSRVLAQEKALHTTVEYMKEWNKKI